MFLLEINEYDLREDLHTIKKVRFKHTTKNFTTDYVLNRYF